MVDLSNALIKSLIIHKVGNKMTEGELIFSENQITLPETLSDLLQTYYLASLKNESFYCFQNTEDDPNGVMNLIKDLFHEKISFTDFSKKAAEQLFDSASSEKISDGDFHVVYFTDCQVDDEIVNAIGFFKSEKRENYLRIQEKKKDLELSYETGINANKPDKVCLVFNTEENSNFLFSISEPFGKVDSQYWKEAFLNIVARKDDFHLTQNVLNITKKFINNISKEEGKEKQIELEQNTVKYFTENQSFDSGDFEDYVFARPDIIDSFRDFKKSYVEEKQVAVNDNFEISDNAVKKESKKFKSVIKLDKNFHIYVHGSSKEMIKKGFDDTKKMNFYQLYFEEED